MLPALGIFRNVKLKSWFLPDFEKVTENAQAVVHGQFCCHRGQRGKMRDEIGADPRKISASLINAALHHAHGQVAFPHNAVAARRLCEQHFIKLAAVFVQGIAFHRQQHRALKLRLVDAAIAQRDFG